MLGHTGSPGRGDSSGASAFMAEGSASSHPGAAANALLDIVVFAGGDSPDMKPLNAFELKCTLRVCNRPMIWLCLAPWIAAGFRTFFIVVNEDYATLRTYLSREFSGVDFYFVFVPLMIGEEASTTCDGVKAYMDFKEQMRAGTVDDSMAVHDGVREGSDSPTATRKTAVNSSSSNFPPPPSGTKPQPLRAERAALPSFRRDALLLSCDTILAGVDVDHFVSNFYSSMASASAMFFRPLTPENGGGVGGGAEALAAGGKEKGHGKKGRPQQQQQAEHKQFSYTYTCVAYEEADEVAAMSTGRATIGRGPHGIRGSGGGAGSGSGGGGGGGGHGASVHHGGVEGGGSGAGLSACAVQHRRLHYMYPLDERPELRITMGFAARRPHLTFAADVMDAHVYLVRHWVLNLISESAGTPDASVSKYILPLLARSQHSLVNTSEGAFMSPDKKINHPIPVHWMYKRHDGELSIHTMNAAKGPLLPERADSLRVFCTIYNENAHTATKIYRINTRDNYQAVNQEIISMKCRLLHLLDEPSKTSQGGGGRGHGRGAPAATVGLLGAHGMPLRGSSAEALVGAGGSYAADLNASASALAYLFPDNPFTLKEKLGSQQVYIVGSFVDSVSPPNTYITRSVIGPNVTIGRGARITDSVILANVDIGPKATITNSIVGSSAVIDGERSVVGCVVAPRCYVEEDQQDTIVE